MSFVFCESSSNVGGQELQILLQMQALREAGHDVMLACRTDAAIASLADHRGLPWRAVAFRNSFHPPSIAALRRLLASRAVRAVLCHSGHDANNAAIAVRLMARRPPLIRVRTYLAGRVKPFNLNTLVDRTLVPSEYLRDRILANPGVRAERLAVLRPLLPLEDIRRTALSPLPDALAAGIAGASPLIVHAAILRPEKGHDVLLQALAGLPRRYPKLRCVLAGAGSPERLQRRVGELGLSAHVLFAGMVMPIYPLLARADLVVMPSLEEPLGLAQLEALALGVPVAVSDAGGLPETVLDGESGWVFPAGNVPAWRDGLAQALADLPRGRRMAQTGRRMVEERFAPHVHLNALLMQVDLAVRARNGRDGTASGVRNGPEDR